MRAVGAGLVELDDLAAEVIIKAEAGQRQLCFLLHIGSIHAVQHQDPLPLPRSVIAVPKGHSGNATVSQEVEAIVTDGIAVHITCQPVDDLFHLAGVLAFAEDITAVYKEIPVDIIARRRLHAREETGVSFPQFFVSGSSCLKATFPSL